MITLSSHTFHALQPLDVACFKPFNTTFKKEKDYAMVNDNFTEPNKITLLGWVDKALDQTLTKKNIISRFKVIGIQPLNLKAMEEKTRLSSLYITVNGSKEEGDDKTSNEEYQDMQW
jgi:hypothetical protein